MTRLHVGHRALRGHGTPTHGTPTHGTPTHDTPTHGTPTRPADPGALPHRRHTSRRGGPGRPSTRPRGFPLGAFATVTCLTATGLSGPSPAHAAFDPVPEATWSPVNGRVHAIARAADRIIIGGTFTSLRSPDSPRTVRRSGLAALDAVTGDLLDWNPAPDGEVRSLEVSADGATVYAGGTFDTVGSTRRNGLVALETATGRVLPGFRADVGCPPFALELVADTLYLGGCFGSVNRVRRARVAAVSATTGAVVTSWDPSASDVVYALQASPDGRHLFVGGRFLTLGGQSRDYIGALDRTTGQILSWRPPTACTDEQYPCYVHGIATDALSVYAAIGGPGGRVSAYDVSTARVRWQSYGDGDVQAVSVDGTTVYAGGHFSGGFSRQERAGVVALSAATGGVLDGFAPHLLEGDGVFTLLADDGFLRVGGGFTSVDGDEARQRYADFPRRPDPPDTRAPTSPRGLRATTVYDTLVTVTWTASSDDVGVAGYRVSRDGAPLILLSGTSWTDRGLDPAREYTYTVEAVDAAGNWSEAGAPLTTRTTPPSSAVVKLGSPWRYISDGRDQGTAWVEPGFDDSSWSTGEAEFGYGDSDEATQIAPRGLTHYFRRTFEVPDPALLVQLTARLRRDDGAVVYLNGEEVWRSNMPSGAITFDTPAAEGVSGTAETTFETEALPLSALVRGSNVVAVEVHNELESRDVSFDLELLPRYATPTPTTPAPTTGEPAAPEDQRR